MECHVKKSEHFDTFFFLLIKVPRQQKLQVYILVISTNEGMENLVDRWEGGL